MKIPSGNSYKLSPLTPADKNTRSGVWEQLWDPCLWAEHAACFGFISSSVDSCPEPPEQHEGWSAPVCAPPQGPRLWGDRDHAGTVEKSLSKPYQK